MKFFDKKFIAIIIFLFIIICISIYFFTKDTTDDVISVNDLYINPEEQEIETAPAEIVVHIYGEVLHPGIVYIPEGSRILDAINAAGGLTEFADISKVNLAYILKDGQKVHILGVYDDENTSYITNDAGENVIIPDDESNTSVININSATITELSTLNGVGESTASKIIKYREENGKFKKIEDIMNVSGIGEAKFDAIKDFICI